MNNDFNLKQFLAEGALLKEETSSDLKKIFDTSIESDRNVIQQSTFEPEQISDFEQAVENAKYGTIEELAESLNEAWAALADSNDEFGEYIEYLIRVCKEMNFKSTKELIRACIDNRYGDYYNEEEKEEEFNQFKDKLEGL
jgi:F0F1-type ATP synthase delta subunit